jgi:hypothetical protein
MKYEFNNDIQFAKTSNYLSIRLDTVKVVTSLLDVCSKLLRWSRWSSAVVTDKHSTARFQPFVETAE